jgi:hypothetical protein
MAAWLAVGKDVAVVSHESALDLHELSDVIPNAVHLTVPRSMRNLPKLPGVKIHTTTRAFEAGDVVRREGMRVTSIERTIVDSADWGTGPEQIEMAVRQALRRGKGTTPRRLEAASAGRSARPHSDQPGNRTGGAVRYSTGAGFRNALETRIRDEAPEGGRGANHHGSRRRPEAPATPS